jgi:hypothetical protein
MRGDDEILDARPDDLALMTNTSLLSLDAPLAATAGIRRWPSDEVRSWVEAFVVDAKGDPRICAIVGYGSAVRDVGRSDDVDLLYVFAGDGIEAATPPFDVDLRGFRMEDVDQRIAAGDEVLGWSLRHGLPLFERDGYWTELQARWAGRLPFPSADAAEERAARALKIAEGLAAGGDEGAAAELRLTALTQSARARLIRRGVFPLSRPELPRQVTSIGEWEIASELDVLLSARIAVSGVEER